MALLIPMKSILTPTRHRCNHGSGIFGTAVSSFLRESDLASRKPVLTPGRCKVPTPERVCSCHMGVAVLAPDMAAKVQIRNQRM